MNWGLVASSCFLGVLIVRMSMSCGSEHIVFQAGLVLLDEPLFLNDFKDDMKKVHHVLASQKTAWPAGIYWNSL